MATVTEMECPQCEKKEFSCFHIQKDGVWLQVCHDCWFKDLNKLNEK